MSKKLRIGLVVPFATDDIPLEGPLMYPDVEFIAKGVGVRSLTPEGYDVYAHGLKPLLGRLLGK